MSKITEEDLKKLFDDELEEISPDDDWHGFEETKPEQIKVTKATKKMDDQRHIKKIRKEIKTIKQPKKRKSNRKIDNLLRFTAFSSLLAFLFFMAMNFPGLFRQFQWTYYSEYLNQEIPSQPTPTPQPTAIPEGVPSILPVDDSAVKDQNKLIIEKLKINAPIAWDVNEDDIIEKLKEGVVHYEGTSKPGEGGNVFIVGHSSNYVWIKSDYNNIFAILDKLVKGDRIEIRYADKSYYYDVVETKIVKPDQVEVLSNTNKEVLSLMTCWPVGTTLNRMIVIAELKYSSNWSTQQLLSQ